MPVRSWSPALLVPAQVKGGFTGSLRHTRHSEGRSSHTECCSRVPLLSLGLVVRLSPRLAQQVAESFGDGLVSVPGRVLVKRRRCVVPGPALPRAGLCAWGAARSAFRRPGPGARSQGTGSYEEEGRSVDVPHYGKSIGGLLRLRGVGHEQSEFTKFYQASWDACLRAVLASVGDQALAEDMVAEAFARAWTSWRKVSQYAAPRGWVVRTALNAGVSWWRPRRRESPLADYDAAAAADPGEGVDPAIVAALRRLPTRQREVIALRVFLDLDTRTTAEILGIAPGTVMAHLSRAAAALRQDPALRNSGAPAHSDITTMEVQ